MVLRNLKGLVHALANGDGRHDNDELRPAVVLVQFIHRLDVGVGLADTRFHLNRQIVATFQSLGRLQQIAALNLLKVLEDEIVRQFRYNRFVAPARERLAFQRLELPLFAGLVAPLVYQIGSREIRLPRKHIHHGLRRVRLKFLMLELKFHKAFTSCLYFSILTHFPFSSTIAASGTSHSMTKSFCGFNFLTSATNAVRIVSSNGRENSKLS